ncbi:hypothetical protein [Azorhizobium sp. AG788]|uniref:hypothetical protein n=1 Tax=Azorhizobium sp. AG788 TaxID=2183897 RepID=UPI003138721E
MRYGSTEFTYAEPFANALVADPDFRAWVLRQTKFSGCAETVVLLHEEMKAKRSKISETWWRSHFTERCRCQGCSGQETDLLALFDSGAGSRFAVHFEIKQPKDKFSTKKDQATNYTLRAACWTTNPPDAVLPHTDASTVLVCCASRLADYAPHLSKFGAVITFQEITKSFPNATPVIA